MKHTVVVNKKFAKFIGIKEHCFMTREMVTAARRLLLARTLSQLSPTFDRASAQALDISSLHRPFVSLNL